MQKIVAFVPIRLNSKRIKNKSIINIAGRPMFCRSLETLDKLGIPVHVYSNDNIILKNMIDFDSKNIIFTNRAKHLDSDDVKGIDIYKEFAKEIESEIYLLCHCTSPFVKLSTYKKCIKSVISGNNSSVTVKREQTFSWLNGKMINFSLPRQKTQDIVPVFIETSAAYCYKKEVLDKDSRTCQNPFFVETSGMEIIDIDNESDLDFIRYFEKGKKR